MLRARVFCVGAYEREGKTRRRNNHRRERFRPFRRPIEKGQSLKTIKKKLKDLRESFASLAFLLGIYRKYALGFLIATVVFWSLWGPAQSLLNVYLSRITIDQIVNLEPFWRIIGVAAIMYGLQLILNLLTNVFEAVFQTPKAEEIKYRVNRDIFMKALGTDYKFYDSPDFYNDFTWAAQNLSSTLERSRSTLENLIQNFAQFIAMAAYISIAGPWVLIVSVIGTIIIAVLNTLANSVWMKYNTYILPFHRRTEYVNRMFYTVDPQADLKATRARNYFLGTYDTAVNDVIGKLKKRGLTLLKFNVGSNATNRATNLIVLALVIKKITSGDVADIALYSSLLVASNSLMYGLSNIGEQLVMFNRQGQYTHRIRKFFATESTIEPTDGAGGAEPPSGALSVDLDNISFAYGEVDGKPIQVLSGLSMHIAAGEKVAIVGENGVGKSTLMKLLLRLYDVSDGEIKIGGVTIGDYDVRKLRDAIGMAFQNSTVYSLPVAENMQVYRETDDAMLREILEKVGLTKLLADDVGLGKQLTREFDDEGLILSGGEMQKFALARLLTGSFGLLILDEPTASLDPLAESALNKLILDRSRPETTIIVAHRLSTIRDADRIFVIDGGTVAECGSHNELIAANGLYRRMFEAQAENYVKE